jgi:hypothetical protein
MAIGTRANAYLMFRDLMISPIPESLSAGAMEAGNTRKASDEGSGGIT